MGCDVLIFNFENKTINLPRAFEEQFLLKTYDKSASNDVFKRVIETNNRLSTKQEEKAPKTIVKPANKITPKVVDPPLKRKAN